MGRILALGLLIDGTEEINNNHTQINDTGSLRPADNTVPLAKICHYPNKIFKSNFTTHVFARIILTIVYSK